MVITGCTPKKEMIETTATENVTETAEVTEIVLETETDSGENDDNFSADETETENFAGIVVEASLCPAGV